MGHNRSRQVLHNGADARRLLKKGKTMISVSTKTLLSAIEEAEDFSLPDMNEGTQYLYDELYGKVSRGMELHLSEIEFDRFELDDVDMMRDLYSDTLEANERKAETITRNLVNIPPAAVVSEFV